MAQELPEGTVTILFTDVVGSTELTNRLGDEAAREVLGACDELVRQQVERHRGQEVKGTGDGLMVAFTSARRAIACAVDIQRATATRSQSEPDRAVSVRIGLNTGEVIREEADLFGATVTAAARIADHASAGEILLPDAVKGVLGAATTVELEDRGETELKGFPEPWRLYSVRWEEKAAGPGLGERTPYVGRVEERALLRRCLDQAARGEGALVMIGGEPGVGKTRLSQELAAEAREKGFLTLTGHCYEMEGAPPYIPFVEILQAAARIVPAEAFREALGDAAPEVAKIMPELRRLFPDIGQALELPPEQERFYLFNCMREFIERAGRGQPLLLVLEDLHWGDDSTLLLLQHIAQLLGEMRVLVVGTYRDVELDVARPLANALEDILRQRLAHDVTLGRLPESDVEAMLRARSGQEPPARLVDVIYRETEGNPFFVEEVFKHLVEAGKIFDTEGRWKQDLEVREEEVPRGVRLVIGRRLERVSEECRRVLTTAAIVGRAFTYELLQELVDIEEDALLDAVDEAGRAQLVSSAAEGGKAQFTFTHEQIRQTLLSTLQLPRRQRLHLRVAEAMEEVYADSLDEHAADLAHHLYQAGSAVDLEKTARYLVLAGNQALAATAFEDSLRYYENAMSLEATDEARTHADLLYKRGQALRSVGRWDEAFADWRKALANYEELGDVETAGQICWEMSDQLNWAGRWAESLANSRRGLAIVGEEPTPRRCRLLAVAGCDEGLLGDFATNDRMLTEALRMAEELADERLVGEGLMYKTLLHGTYLQPQAANEAGLRAVELLRSAGSLWDLCHTLSFLPQDLLEAGRLDEAAQIVGELLPLADRIGHLGALVFGRNGNASREVMVTADIGGFEERSKETLELCRSADMPWSFMSHGALGQAHFWRGRWQQALESFQEADRLEIPGVLTGSGWALLFMANAYMGERDVALAMLEQRRASLPRPGQPSAVGAWEMVERAVEGLAVLGEREQAAAHYATILEAIDSGTVVDGSGSRLVEAVAGIAAACGGQWEKAEEHYQKALRQAQELPHKIEQPEVRRWYARMLIDRDGPGDREKARTLLTEAVAMYRQIGMPKHIEMAETMRAKLQPPEIT